jgi:hypothetical protein
MAELEDLNVKPTNLDTNTSSANDEILVTQTEEYHPIKEVELVDSPVSSFISDTGRSDALTVDEQRDPGKILAEITDFAPIVVLFGARTSGKTMTLVRLSRYLKQNGYVVDPIRTFRPSNSVHYQEMCDNFNNNIFSNQAPGGTAALSFMLVKVSNKFGDPICQILEAPGEHYFDPRKDNTFPPYILQIVENSNPKTWVFITELDWMDNATRMKYAEKVKEMRNLINPSDKVILMAHKADKKMVYFFKGHPDKHHFYRDIKQQYPAIFAGHINSSPILRLFTPYAFRFVVFSAGKFSTAADGTETYIPSNDKYPAELWKNILKTVKGGWF